MKNLRDEIDRTDKYILNLFIKRLLIVLKILKIKEKNKLKIVDLKREKEILKKVLKCSILEKFKPFNHLLFLNILNISKILQYNFILEKTEKKQQTPFKKFSLKKFEILYFKLPKEFLNSKIFFGYTLKKTKKFKFLLDALKTKKTTLAMIRVKNINKSVNFLTKNFNCYVNFIFKFKNEFYLIVSNKILLKNGFNLVCLTLTINFNLRSFLNLIIFFMLKKIKILDLNFKIINTKEAKIFFKLRCFYKKKNSYIKFFKILETNFKNLKILGVFKAIKVC